MAAQIVLTAVGIWLMVAPSVLDYQGSAATSDRIAGPIVVAIAFLAVFAITRGLRWLNLPVGVWLVASPLILDIPGDATINALVCGVLTLVLAPIGHVDQSRYGGGWVTLWRTEHLPPSPTAGDPRRR